MDFEDFWSFLIVDEDKKPDTIEDLRRVLRRMLKRGLNVDLLTEDHECAIKEGRRYLGMIKATRGPSEQRKNVQVVNALLRWKDIPHKFGYPRSRRSVPCKYTAREVALLRAFTATDELTRLRGRALVDLALQTGMRRAEVAAMNACDVDVDEGTIQIVRPAKNGLARKLPLDSQFLKPSSPFMMWLRARPVRRDDPNAVWVTLNESGPGRRLPKTVLGSLMTTVGRDCGLRASFVRSRHTRATELLGRGVHIRYLQYYLGHADISSTMVYLEADEVDLQEEFERLRKRK